jgi:hypothetical protein
MRDLNLKDIYNIINYFVYGSKQLHIIPVTAVSPLSAVIFVYIGVGFIYLFYTHTHTQVSVISLHSFLCCLENCAVKELQLFMENVSV